MKVLVTGGAGFVGSNLAHRLLSKGHEVSILDNLSRKGTAANITWLQDMFGDKMCFIRGDICDAGKVREAVEEKDAVFHLAAQTAVTSSIKDPMLDFNTNALGTLMVLEAARIVESRPLVVFSSTNKVYGSLSDMSVSEQDTRYEFTKGVVGISETRSIDFSTPYGCSKGCGDQYVRDYNRIFNLRTVVFRISCVVGERQIGSEDQGWVAHFVISALKGRKISVFGDGKQVRDILYVGDLLNLCEKVLIRQDIVNGKVYNVGGGPERLLSLVELLELLKNEFSLTCEVEYQDFRLGDQRVYVSDIKKAERELGWVPQCSVKKAVGRVFEWASSNLGIFVDY